MILGMNHLHLLFTKEKDNIYLLSFVQLQMYETILYDENILSEFIIKSDSRFRLEDIKFIRDDLVTELKKNHKIKTSNITYKYVETSKSFMIKQTKDIIIETNDIDGLTNQIYGLINFYQTMFVWKELPPEEVYETDDEEIGGEANDAEEEEFYYY
jgi:hypothetical protein